MTVAFLFRAMTTEPELLPRTLVAADTMNATYLRSIQDRLARSSPRRAAPA